MKSLNARRSLIYDLRYQTKNNVLGRPLYPDNMPCLLKTETAMKLRRAAELVARRGFSLKIWDGWRPPEVQALFHDQLGHTGLFLDPMVMWSRHCTGTAVDLTLVTDRGRAVEMPTDFDEAGSRARFDAGESSLRAKANLAVLQHAMHDVGFLLIDSEWWHFDDGDYAFNQPRVVSAKDLGLVLPL
jgi:zinc D-Ala-D-Ala dipeptidase